MRKLCRLCGIFFIILAIVILQIPAPEVWAGEASDFVTESNKLLKYKGNAAVVEVPKDIVTIGKGCFEDNRAVTKISIPDMVKTIQTYAFWGCDRLETVRLGNKMTEISEFSFANCKGLRYIEIPDSVSAICAGAFEDCSNLEDITIPPSVTSIHETAFDGCRKLIIHCEEGSYADKFAQEFYKRQLEMVEYEEVVDSILPEEVPKEPDTFEEQEPVKEKENSLGNTVIVNNEAVFLLDSKSPHVINGQEQINETTKEPAPSEFDEKRIPKYCVVDNRIVADQAYYKNKELNEVEIPEGISEIGSFSFARSSLQEIHLPESTEKIGLGAFYHADGLQKISLPMKAILVEPMAFTYTRWVEDFLKEEEGSDFLIGGSTLIAYKGKESKVVVPDNVKAIAAGCFVGHEEIIELELPENLEIIGEEAFAQCKNLTSVSFGQKLYKIADRAFAGTNLKNVALPSSLKEQGLHCFEKDCKLSYASNTPLNTHELSAQRLSNNQYREVFSETERGVSVFGIENALCDLPGAQCSYKLTVKSDSVTERIKKAYERNLGKEVPIAAKCFELTLTDSSSIPITNLGKQKLILYLPIEQSDENRNYAALCLDRNGQPEKCSVQRVTKDEEIYLRVELKWVGELVVCEEEGAASSLQQMDVSFLQNSKPISAYEEKKVTNTTVWRGILFGLLSLSGVLLLFVKKH